jgi:hypothetical protein
MSAPPPPDGASAAHTSSARTRDGGRTVEQDAPAVEVGIAIVAAGELVRDGGQDVPGQGRVGGILADDAPHV